MILKKTKYRFLHIFFSIILANSSIGCNAAYSNLSIKKSNDIKNYYKLNKYKQHKSSSLIKKVFKGIICYFVINNSIQFVKSTNDLDSYLNNYSELNQKLDLDNLYLNTNDSLHTKSKKIEINDAENLNLSTINNINKRKLLSTTTTITPSTTTTPSTTSFPETTFYYEINNTNITEITLNSKDIFPPDIMLTKFLTSTEIQYLNLAWTAIVILCCCCSLFCWYFNRLHAAKHDLDNLSDESSTEEEETTEEYEADDSSSYSESENGEDGSFEISTV
ncbi:MAG: hypothetical protein GY830_00760 [Bacteroidetes bacterium]|nr:hypothetical protein [Bacteroidota bacterium]